MIWELNKCFNECEKNIVLHKLFVESSVAQLRLASW